MRRNIGVTHGPGGRGCPDDLGGADGDNRRSWRSGLSYGNLASPSGLRGLGGPNGPGGPTVRLVVTSDAVLVSWH